MYTTVIFDLGGVLLDLDMDACFQNMRNLDVDINALSKSSSPEDKGAVICDGMTASGALHLYQVGKISTHDFITLIQTHSRPGTTYKEALDAWNSCLLTIPKFKLDYIRELKAKGYHVHLLSNTNDAHWKYISEQCFPEPPATYFDKIFLSHELQLAKPDPAIFQTVLTQLSIPAEECLFIDDSSENCQAAQRLSINTYNTPVRYDFRENINKILNEQE